MLRDTTSCLAVALIEKTLLRSKTQQKRVPYKNVPSVTLGRLPIDKSIHHQGYGETLVTHAMKVVYQASQAVFIHGMFVEASTSWMWRGETFGPVAPKLISE